MTGMRLFGVLMGAAALSALSSCGDDGFVQRATVTPKAAATGTPTGQKADIWLTTTDQKALVAQQPQLDFYSGAAPDGSITVDTTKQYQEIVGYGAAMTDAAAYVMQHDMTAAQRSALMNDLFGSAGAGFSFLRVPLGSSDFSQTMYSFDDQPAGNSDPTLAGFSIAPAQVDLIPTLKQALSVNAAVRLMGTPWSPPAWMKTSGSLIGGTLQTSYYPQFAQYLTKTAQAFAAQGVPFSLMSIQNEPDFEPPNYAGMRLSAAQRAAIVGGYVGPAFAAAGLGTIGLLDWDHNWDQPQQPTAVLSDAVASRYIAGVAWHCYAGDVSAQGTVHDQFPAKDAYFTECTGTDSGAQWPDAFVFNISKLMIGASRNWARGIALWNIALDENDGPHNGGCGNCRPVVTINSKTGAVTKNVEYYALSHLSRFVQRGAHRISSTQPGTIQSVAFLNPDNSKVLLAFNSTATAQTLTVTAGSGYLVYTLPGYAAVTVRWN